MATVNSNIVKSPQQAALDKKKGLNPLQKLALGTYNSVNSMMAPAAKFAANAIVPGASQVINAGQSYMNPVKPVPVAQPQVQATVTKPTVPAAKTQATVPATQQPNASAPSNTYNFQTPEQVAATDAASQGRTTQDDHTPRFTSLIGSLIKYAQGNGAQNPQVQAGLDEYKKKGDEIAELRSAASTGRSSLLTSGMTSPVAQGRGAVIAQNEAAQETALTGQQATALQAANTAISSNKATTDALTAAGGLLQPVTQFGQLTDPTTGQPIAGNGSLQDAVNLQVNKLKQGTVGYNDAVAALQAYGQAGTNALQQALGPSFDINASNANAAAKGSSLQQTVQQGRATAQAAVSAKQALDSLQTAYSSLDALSGASDIPIANWLTQTGAMQTGVNRAKVSNYIGALNEARAQVRGVLGASGVNPVDAGDIADHLLPAQMIPSEVPQKILAAKSYIDNRVNALSSTGNVPQFGSQPQTQSKGFGW